MGNQKKRIDAKMKLGANKFNKSGAMNATKDMLMNALGGTKAFNTKSPICAGRYNDSTATSGSEVLLNMTTCDTDIKTACNVTMSKQMDDDLNKCYKLMEDFRVEVNKTKEAAKTDCSKWES